MIELVRYRSGDGREPFGEWLRSLGDRATEARIRVRLGRVQAGNFGDCEPVGEGVIELRIHVARVTEFIAAVMAMPSCCFYAGAARTAKRLTLNALRSFGRNGNRGRHE